MPHGKTSWDAKITSKKVAVYYVGFFMSNYIGSCCKKQEDGNQNWVELWTQTWWILKQWTN